MRRKTVAFVILLVVLASAYCITSVSHMTVAMDGPLTLFDFFKALGTTAMVLGDPVPGGSGSGGNN